MMLCAPFLSNCTQVVLRFKQKLSFEVVIITECPVCNNQAVTQIMSIIQPHAFSTLTPWQISGQRH